MNSKKDTKERGPNKATLSTLTTLAKHFRQYELDNNTELDLSKDLPDGTWTIIKPKLLSEGHKGNFPNMLSRYKAIVQNILNSLKDSLPTQQSIYPTEQSEPDEQSVSSEPIAEPDNLDAKIDGRIQQKIAELTSVSFLQDLPMPPARIKEKRKIEKGKREGQLRMKETRLYDRPSMSIDKRIFSYFAQEAAKRGMNHSMLFEAILIKVFDIKLN